ncbi:E3 ubiquitin-protein ligase RNF213 [Alligator mississippiensis]|uniref:E3 ubiquitin-protein ligase RNF213 n=1 Tax=Alligator mississippiensis TaxID=8496 RepID=A0A151NYG6_ALLMI|nr:E3 ubiquitin-protein ligase RNF213 [Alligator mississippiensis]
MAENRLQGTEDVELDNREPKPLTDDAKSDLVVRAGSQPEANAAGLKNEGHKDAHSEGACPEEEEGDNQQQPEVSIHAEATLRRACVQVHPLSEGYSAGKESSSGSQPDCETAEEAKETCDFGQTGTEVTPCTDVAEHKGSEELTECTARCLPNPCSSNTEHMTLEFIAPLSSKWTCKGSNVKIVVGIYKEPGVYEECADMHLAANKDIERIIAKGRISLSNLQHGKPLYYRYGILDFYDDNRPLQLEDFPETSSKNKKNLFLRVLVIPERTIEANGVWTQYDDTCHFQNEGWRLFRGTPSVSKDSISYVVKEFRQECKQNFTDLERKIHCYILCSKARKRFDVKQNKTTEVGCKKEETANIICKFAEEIIKMPKAPDCTASIVQELLFSLYILFYYKLPIHRGFWTEIKNVLPYTYPLEGKLPNLTEDRKSDYIRALMYTCKSRSSSESRSSGWMWLIPLLYAVAYQGPTSEATQKLLHEEIKQLSFHLLGTEGKQEKVIKMIKAHQTFIEKCAPLAKQIIEMLTLNSLAEVLTLPIRLPLLPLLERVCSQDFTEGKIKENISRSVLTELVGRTESWLRDKFLLQKEKSVLEAKELEDILRGVELVFSLVKNCFQNSWSNEVIPALQILNVFSSTEDLLKNEKAFKNLRGTDRCKNFEKCAKEWVEKAFPKPQKKSHFLKGIDKWQQLFSVRLFCDEWTTQWQELIHLSYSEWIKKIEHEDLFSYYKAFLDTEKYQDRDLASSLLEHIIQNIEKMPKTKVTGLQHIIRNFSRMKTSVVEKILSAVIESMWTEDLRLITEPTRFEEETGNVIVWLLESSLGQDIISTIHQPKRPICINEKAQELLSKVLKLLSFVGDSLFLGDIPCSVLRGLLKHKQGFITMLCTIDKSPKKSECFTHQNITHVLDIREQELKQLEEQKKQKCAFIKMCNSISAVIKVDLDGMTQSTDEKQSIRNQMSVKTFSIEEEIKRADTEPPALAKYDSMVRKVYTLKESQCFPKLWKLKAEQAKGKFPGEAILSLDEAQENIYNPAMEDFEKTYRSLKDCSINFGSIKRQFKTVIKEKVLLKKEFEIMENSMGEAGSKRSWVETAMDKIHNYETLSTVVQTAQMINELRRELGLDGDFQILDDLTRYNEEDFKNKRLDYITDDVMKVKKTLSDLSPNVLDFLKELLECSKKSFVSWVKAIIKDRTELPTFVDLASISAGEDNMDFDKVQFFHNAISVSGPIIFDLNSTSGFEDFCAALQPIKEAIVDDNVLPEKLRVSCLNKEWLQMPSLDDCISLELPEDDAKSAPQQDATAKKAYSLAQLTELQNKLMLIATKVEQGQEEAKRFLEILEKIRMVGKLYLELLEVGNILFIDWKAQVDCGHKHNINIYVEFGISGVLVQSNRPFLEELSGICRAMERCLGEWKKYLETQRNNYYHLNMFTARQLFYLCSKLATANKTEVDLQVLNLLSVFKHDITVEDIRDALNKALETPSESISMAGEDEQSVTWLSYTVKFPQLIQSLVDAGYDESVVKAGLQSYSPNVAITEQMLMEYALEHGENEEEIEELSKLYEEQREDFLQKSKKFKKRSTEAEQYAFSSLTKDKLAVSFESLPSIQDKVNLLWDAYCTRLTGLVSDRYISLDVFGEMLKCLATAEASCIERNLPVGFEAGRPGLVMCKEEEMLRYMLSVYRCTEKAPLPTSEEVLVCTSETREEDVELIVRRALSPGSKHKKIYCLLGADKLVYKVSKKLEFQFFHLAQSSSVPDYRFLIFCDAKAHNSYIITAFDNYKVSLSCNSEADIQQYLRTHLTVPMAPVTRAFEEPYRQNMKFVFSEEAGMGKSLFVANTIKKAKDLPENTGLTHKTIRMMESEINFGFLLKELCSLEDKPTDVVPRIFHIDVSPVVSKGLYRLLIELCILRHTQSPDGLVWKCKASHLYLIEYMVRGKGISSTRKQEMTSNMEREFLALLPAVKCVSPVEVLEVLGKSSSGTDVAVERQLLDRGTFKGEAFQRSYQYLRRYQNHQNLDRFCYSPQTVEGTEEECLRLLLQCCGRKNPSWTELSNFAQFLSLQLMKCETSVFCSEAAGREFGGFKSFVIKFMIAMSKDFAMPSLVMSDESFPRGEGKKEEDSVLTGYQLRRKWEQESHPYIDAKQIQDLYFGRQKHDDLTDVLRKSMKAQSNVDATTGLCLEVSTHARLLNQRELDMVTKKLNLQNRICCVFLSQFETEHAFRQELSKFFSQSPDEKLFLVQFNFDEPQSSKRLLACAKYCIVDERRKSQSPGLSHVVIITKVPRIQGGSGYLAFSGDEWTSLHLDELLPLEHFTAPLGQLSKMSVAEVFMKSAQQGLHADGSAKPGGTETGDSRCLEEKVQLLNIEYLIKQSVQKAVIQLEDKQDNRERATRRIQILYDALFSAQKKTAFAHSFMGELKKRICRLLQEREKRSLEPKEWTFHQAKSGKFILEGASFRHTLWIYIEDIMVNVFAQILAVIDANNNLDHISQEAPLSDLWLRMFQDESFLKIKYTSKVPDAKIAVLSMTEDPNTSVVCQFPFSWVLKADLDAIWETVHQAKGFPRDPTRDSAEMFQRLIQNVPMPDVDEVDVVQFYASDFVRMALPGQDLKVYEVLSNVLITGAKKLHSSVAGNDLRFSLIWLHIEYFYLRDTYQLFIDLVKTEESITDELQNMYSKDSTAMFVSLDALNILLRQLQPTEETFVSFATCLAWLKRVQSIKHTLNWVTSDDYQIRLYSEKGKLLSSILHRWNSTNIIYLLIDHLLHDETEMDEKLLRTVVKQSVFLWSLLYKTEDLKPEKIFEIVTKVLKTCSNHAVKVYFGKGVDKCRSCQQEITDPAQLPCAHIFCTQCILDWKHKQCRICKENIPKDYTPTVSQVTREAVENCNKFRRKCNSFFVEFVSSYCFGGRIPLPAKVIEQLIKFVACKPANSEHPESRCGKSNLSSPTHSTIRVYKPTSDLSPFEECMDPSPTVKSSLLKMLLQCRLDDVKIHLQAYLSRMEEVITSNQSIRDDFYFMVVRCFEDFMYSSSQEDASQEAEHCITSADLSTPSCAAVTDVHTLQLIARLRLAISHVATVLGTEFLSAAVPETRMNSEDAEKHRALLNAMKNMVENAQTPWPQIFLFRALLNIHGLNIMQKVLERERWILPRGCETSEFMDTRSNKTLMVSALGKAEDQLNSIKSEAAKNLTAATKQMESILEVPSLSEEPTEKLKKILSVIRSRDNCTCLEVVFHTAVVLSLSQQPITQVFRSICFQPSAVKDTYLPTMPGDLVSDVQNWKMTESEKMWKCQCGRLWCVENCGHPWVKEQCPCGHTVGGIFHKPVEGFAEVDTSEDRTERGYILGSPDSRSSEAERDLPAASVCLARVLLHSSMLLGTFTDRQSILNLMKKKPEVAKKFFQDHLEKDIAFLAESLGRNRDDATITVHLFLSYLLEVTAGKKMTAKSMHKKEDRIEWENCFKTLTQSFFQRLNEKLASAKQQIVEEAHSSGILKTADGQHLPFGDLPSTGLINQPCMWRFEQRMTIQHLTHVIQQESETSQFPVLLQILSKHHHIQYIQHLPDILSLQHALIHSYQNCDIHEEEQFSVREFLEQSHISGDQRLAFKGAVHIIQKVWSNIKLNPKSTGMQIPEELQNKEIDTDTAVLDLLPTDPSISSIVTKFLIELQNSLIDTAAQLTKEKQRSVSAEEVRVSSVITVTPSDMITMALSNFQYVLEENGTKTTQFNFQTLQRQAINRFISGKPSIKVQTAPSMPPRHLKTLQFTKAKVKEQLSQELLSVSQVKSVMEAARSVSDISRALSTLKVAAEFLAVTGGEPGRLLTDYVRNELRMDADAKHFRDLPVVPQTQLKHILSLWQVLSVRRSVLLVQMNQNPFFLVDKRYQEELEAVEREELTKALSTINIDFFIADLHEMIVVTLGSYSPKWGIVETFEGYLQQEGKEDQYIENLTRTLSQDLQMKHVISVWKTAVQTSKLYGSGYNRE